MKNIPLYSILLFMPFIPGCSCLGYPLFVVAGDVTDDVKAEFTELQGKTVAVVVHADGELLARDAYLKHDVGATINTELKERIEGITVINQRAITAYQNSNPNWESLPAGALGDVYDADFILHVVVLDMTVSDPDVELAAVNPETDDLGTGTLYGEVYVVRGKGPGKGRKAYREDGIKARYPDKRIAGRMDETPAILRTKVLRQFAQKVVWKFYDHEEPTR
jgi:hypothetical protein